MIRIKMGIVRKTVIILASIFVFIILVLFLHFRFIFMKEYIKLEEESAVRNIEQAENVFNDKIDKIATSAEDYAIWDNTYFFMADNNQDYIDSNFDNDTLDNLGINFLVLIDASNKIKYIYALDLNNKERIELAKSFEDSLLKEVVASEQSSQSSENQGVLLLDGKPVIAAARPILKTMVKGLKTELW